MQKYIISIICEIRKGEILEAALLVDYFCAAIGARGDIMNIENLMINNADDFPQPHNL
jgi:hypothetical protein